MESKHDYELATNAALFEEGDDGRLMLAALDRDDGDGWDGRVSLDDIVGPVCRVESATPYTLAPFVALHDKHRELFEHANAEIAAKVARYPNPTVYRVRITATVEALSPEESAAAIKAARDREIAAMQAWRNLMSKAGE